MKQKTNLLSKISLAFLSILLLSVIILSCKKDFNDSDIGISKSKTLTLGEIKEKYGNLTNGGISSRGSGNKKTPLNAIPIWNSFIHKVDSLNNDYFVFRVEPSSISLKSDENALLSFNLDNTNEIRSNLILSKSDSSKFFDSNFMLLEEESKLTGIALMINDSNKITKVGGFENGFLIGIRNVNLSIPDSVLHKGNMILSRDEADDIDLLAWILDLIRCYKFEATWLQSLWNDFCIWWYYNNPFVGIGTTGSNTSSANLILNWRDVTSWAFLWRNEIGWNQYNDLFVNTNVITSGSGGNSNSSSWQLDLSNCRKKIKEAKLGGGDPDNPIIIQNESLCDLNKTLLLSEAQFQCLYNKGLAVSALNDFLLANGNSAAAMDFAKEYISYTCTFNYILPPPAELFELFNVMGFTQAEKTELLLNPNRLAGFLESLKTIKSPNQQSNPHFLIFPPIPGHSLCSSFFTFTPKNEIDAYGKIITFQWTIFNNLSIRLTLPNGNTIDRQIGDNWVFRCNNNSFNEELLPNLINNVLNIISQNVTNGSLNVSMVQTTFLRLVNAQLGKNGFLWTAGSLDQNLCSFYIPRTNSGQIDVPFKSISLINLNSAGCP